MINRIKSLNEALPEVLVMDAIYLILGEIIILLLFDNPGIYAMGFLIGVIYAVFATFHMSLRIHRVVYGRADSTKTFVIGYFLRLLVMFLVFALLYWLNIGDLLAALMGMFAMKVSAYLQPFTHRISSKILKKGG